MGRAVYHFGHDPRPGAAALRPGGIDVLATTARMVTEMTEYLTFKYIRPGRPRRAFPAHLDHVAALKSHRKNLCGPSISEHKGRIVKLMDTGLLAVFSSAVEAKADLRRQHPGAEQSPDIGFYGSADFVTDPYPRSGGNLTLLNLVEFVRN